MVGVVARRGDLFAVPLGDGSFGVGVVASMWMKELYLVLFAERFANEEQAASAQLEQLTPILASSSLDAKIWHRHWPILRRGVNATMLPQPVYKVEEPSGFVAESFDRESRRHIDADVATLLDYRRGVAPVRLEKALKAHHGLAQWDSSFDELAYSRVLRSNEAREKWQAE